MTTARPGLSSTPRASLIKLGKGARKTLLNQLEESQVSGSDWLWRIDYR